MHSPNTYTETALPNCPFRLHRVPGGTFLMGSANDEPDALDWEKPVHPVELDPFYIAEFPVTQDLWVAVMGENPSGFPGERRPVENVSWNDITERFLPALNKKCGKAYRLPTEAEWEYAARGGPFWKAEGYRYAGSDDLGQVGWYTENSGDETHEVGLLLPNALGLYDMSGNVWEWCADRFSGKWYDECDDLGTVKNPTGPEQGGLRVDRGGGYFNGAQGCRAASRRHHAPADRSDRVGFRLVLSPQSVG
jgi:formylglycine-generating enzyme required for sulfatase activity